MDVLNHPNIVKFYEKIESHDSYNYILELVKGCDLCEFVMKRECLTESVANNIMKELLHAMISVHSSGVIHRDLKPENIMIETSHNDQIITSLKIIDFGFSIFAEDLKDDTPRCGTMNFIAPEVLGNEPYGIQADSFSLGVILYFLLSGELPFDSDENYIIKQKTLIGDYDLDYGVFEFVSDLAKDLIRQLLEPNPDKRITVQDAFTHDWILNKKFYLSKFDKQMRKGFKSDFDMGRYI